MQKCKYEITYSSITLCRPDRYSSSKLIIKHSFILYKMQVTTNYIVSVETLNIGLQGLDIIDTYTNSIVEMYFYLL